MAKEGKKYKDIKKELSKKYGMSVSSIEKLVYRRGQRAKGKPLCPADISPVGENLPAHNTKIKKDEE
jgi:hypothetical protein